MLLLGWDKISCENQGPLLCSHIYVIPQANSVAALSAVTHYFLVVKQQLSVERRLAVLDLWRRPPETPEQKAQREVGQCCLFGYGLQAEYAAALQRYKTMYPEMTCGRLPAVCLCCA
jgi:hypothetical protein